MMKLRILTAVAALTLLFSLTARAQRLPVQNLEDARGKTVSSATLVDHKTPFAITFWASWCKFCRKELDALAEQAPDWDTPLRIYAVCEDDSRSIARARALAAGSEWPAVILYDTNGEFKRALHVGDIPHVLVFDKDGNQVWSHVGYIPGDENTLVAELLKAR